MNQHEHDAIITVDDVMALRPCGRYDRAKVAALIGDGIALIGICDLPIPAKDRVWFLSRLCSDDVCEAATSRIVNRAVEKYALHCSTDAVELWAARWLSGHDRTEASAQTVANAVMAAAWAAEAAATSAARTAGCAAEAVEYASLAAAAADGMAVWGCGAYYAEYGLQVEDYRAAIAAGGAL